MNLTAVITGGHVSFMGWDEPQNRSPRAGPVPEPQRSVKMDDSQFN